MAIIILKKITSDQLTKLTLPGFLFLFLFLFFFALSPASKAACLNDYHVQQMSIQHQIPRASLKRLDDLALAGDTVEGWRQLVLLKDPYAVIAANVLAPNPKFPDSIYKKLVAAHWLNTNSQETVKKNFSSTALQHFRQYVEILHSGYWPDSDQILLSYLTATRTHNLRDITVFDASWDSGGFNYFRTWQSLNKLPDERIVYPTKACYQIDANQARRVLTQDFSKLPFQRFVSDHGRDRK
jgi:hypothetical protein